MLRRLLFALSIAVIVPQASAQEPQWLVEARAREGKLEKPKELRSADGFFRASVPARLIGEITEDEGSYQIQLDIGSESPANCELILDGFDPASLLRATAELTFPEVEAHQGKVEQRAVERVDAGVFGGSPFVAVDWIYRVNDGNQLRLGGLKQIAAEKGDHGVYCAHVDLGYSKTFAGVVSALVDSLHFADAGEQPYFAEVHTVTLQSSRVGVATVTMTRDADGDTKLVTKMSLVVPVTPDTLRTVDSYDVQWVRPDDSMINASHITVENGEVETNLRLNEMEDEQWQVEGLFSGKEISEVIAADQPPGTDIWYSRAKRDLLATPEAVGGKVSAPRWITADPTRFHEMTTSVLAAIDDGQFSARESAAGLTADMVLDKNTGTAISAKVPMGPTTIELERVHVQGSF